MDKRTFRQDLKLRTLVALACMGLGLAVPPCADSSEPESVILLHGLGRTEYSMRALRDPLVAAGFKVHAFTYGSMRRRPGELTDRIDREVAACCGESPRVHFVTHSLGGILVRAYLSERRLPNMGRVVMLAPPNKGSELVDAANGSSLLRAILGPTGIQLGTGPDSLPNRLPPPWYPVGIIAGIDDMNPIGGRFVPDPSDGTVSVASTRLDGMTDFITVRRSHTFIMRSAEVSDYVIRFLRTGRFRMPEEGAAP